MVARPTNRPRWATDPSTFTEPTEGMKNTGWVANDPPNRSVMNWFMRRTYDALEWFFQSEPRSSDLFEDQGLPGIAGDRPSVGAGLGPIDDDDFTGAAYADGYRVPPTDGPGAGASWSYAASKDTYWDLSSAGVWTAAVVNSGAGAPALTANSTRMYRVRTDGTDRLAFNGTDSIDYRATRVRASAARDDVDVRRGALNTLKGIAITTGELVGFRVDHAVDLQDWGSNNYRYQAWSRWNDIAGAVFGARVYSRRITGDAGGIQLAVVFGADCTTPQGAAATDVIWTARATTAHRFLIRGVGDNSVVRYSRIPGLIAGSSTFTDAAWEDAQSGNSTRYQLPIGFGLKFGSAPMNPSSAAGNLVPILGELVRGTGFALTDIMADLTASIMPWHHYTGAALDGGLTAPSWAVNATFRASTGDWIQYSSHNSYLLQLSSNGLHLYWHDGSTPGTTWNHEIGDAHWRLLCRIAGPNSIIPASGPAIISPKAFGYVEVDDTATIVASRLEGCTVAIQGTDAIRVTLDEARASTHYTPVSTIRPANKAGGYVIQSTTQFDIGLNDDFTNLASTIVAFAFVVFES